VCSLKAIARLEPITRPQEAALRRFSFPTPEELSPPILRIENGIAGYGETTVLSRLDLRIDQDDRIALLGQNGQGKSTLAKLISGRLKPLAGQLVQSSKLRIGYFAQHQVDELYVDETPIDHVRRLRPSKTPAQLRAILGGFGIGAEQAETLVGRLSGGQKARLSLLLATIDAPHLLILDEPTDGLDPNQKHEVRELLTEMAGKKAVIISTHILEEVEAVCSRAIIIAKGKLVADQDPLTLQSRSRLHNAIGIRLPMAQVEACTAVLNGLEQVTAVQTSAQVRDTVELLAVSANGLEILDPVRAAIDAKGIHVNEIFVERGRLEDVFRDLTFEVEGLKARPIVGSEVGNA